MIQVENISMEFDDNKVLDQVNFHLEPSEITALVGRNGSGKTTLLNILGRTLEQKSGKIMINGVDVEKKLELQANIAYLPDQFDFFKFETIEKTMKYYKIVYPNFDIDFVLRELKRHNIDKKMTMRKLSKGNLTLAGLIIILGTGTKYILLDEVLDGMDVLNKETIMRYLIDASAEGKGILVSSHQLQELQGIATRILYLSLDGTLQEMTTKDNIALKKYQIVTKGELPQAIAKKAIIRFSIGRVHTILVEGEHADWDKIFLDHEIVQYDILPVQLEDFFFWEEGRKGGQDE